jgi:sulfoxide reductase heme-binding subunit YedZ
MKKRDGTRFVKAVVFVNCLIPLGYVLWDWQRHALGPNPIDYVTRATGTLTILFLTLTLAVTPLQKLTGWGMLNKLRRMIGLYAFFYGTLHFLIYLVLDRLASLGFPDGIVAKAAGLTMTIGADIYERPFITIGFTALVLMVPLAATSTAGMIRRLGGQAWQRLHRLIYLAAIAGVVHYWWGVKADVTRPQLYALIVGALLLVRLFWARGRVTRNPARAAAETEGTGA